MFKNLLFCFFGLVFVLTAKAQAPNYTFQALTGTYTPISGGTSVVLTYNGTANYDDGLALPANAVPIGFTFYYNGQPYTTIRPCANGWATFSNNAPVTNENTWGNSLSTGITNYRPIIAPLWDDHDMGAVGAVTYLLTGATPNRVLTIQWAGAKWDYNAAGPVESFQVKLYETTNVIDFVYKQEATPISTSSGGASIGITGFGTGSGTYLSLTSGTAGATASSTTSTNNIITKPATDQIFRWTPPCQAGALDVSPTSGGEKIGRVQIGFMDNPSTGLAGYEDFRLKSGSGIPGGTVTVIVTLTNGYFADQVLIWVDFNRNGNYGDAGELVYTSPIAGGPFTATFTIPAGATLGQTTMRIRLHDTSAGPNATPCGNSTWGQVEDYSLNIYCTTNTVDPQQNLGERISRVQFGSINNASTANVPYENFTNISAIIQRNTTTNPITITGSGTYFADQSYVWIDYNQNGIFEDPAELVFTSVISAGPYVGNVNVPGTALLGPTRMRVKLQDTQGPPLNSTPCGNAGWGQVEDYTIIFVDCQPAVVVTRPANTTLCNNSSGSFTVGATGTGLTYQWLVSTNGGATYTNTTNGATYTGSTTPTLSITNANTTFNGYVYKVILGGTCTAANTVSSTAVLSINLPPVVGTITTTPSTPLCEAGSVSYGITVTGTAPTYQWQVSVNGGTYTDVVGETNSTLTLNAINVGMNGNQYRVAVTVAPCATAFSAPVTFFVNSKKVAITAPVTKLYPFTTTTLTATPVVVIPGATYTYQWFRNGVLVSGTGNTRVVSIDQIGDYTVIATSSFGCISALSAPLTIGDSATNQLFVYPNPNRGKFYIRYFTEFFSYNPNPGLNLALIRTINVFDSKGQLMFTRKLSANHSWGRMDVDMTTNAKGVYFIELGDVDGRRLTTTRVVIQ